MNTISLFNVRLLNRWYLIGRMARWGDLLWWIDDNSGNWNHRHHAIVALNLVYLDDMAKAISLIIGPLNIAVAWMAK